MVKMTKCNEKHDKPFIRRYSNGTTYVLILWIISREKIHGYGIMKKLDEFFAYPIEHGYVKKTNPSKIYPILNKFEENDLITGIWDLETNKKYYEITEKGEKVLNTIRKANEKLRNNKLWKEFFNDMKEVKK